jgi:predicted small secreted protein
MKDMPPQIIKYRVTLVVIVISFLLSACGSTSTVKQPLSAAGSNVSDYRYKVADISSSSPDVPPEFISNLRKYLEKSLDKKGVLGKGKSAKNVTVKITDFKMTSRGKRLVLGMLAGKDLVKSTVNVTDPGSGKPLGSTVIESGDSLNSGQGPELFTSGHAKAIAKFLLGKG